MDVFISKCKGEFRLIHIREGKGGSNKGRKKGRKQRRKKEEKEKNGRKKGKERRNKGKKEERRRGEEIEKEIAEYRLITKKTFSDNSVKVRRQNNNCRVQNYED